ncbi:MAG: DsrE family protein [Tardiphaga sp.]|nr:DsrE family protein [Tardiphaga sp.]
MAVLGLAAAMLTGHTASAQVVAAPAPEKAFADHYLALQLSDNDPKKQAIIISIAYNMLKVYGPDQIAIEVVTFGPGIDLLKADNANRQRIDSLVEQGVRFDVCGNTLDTVERETGQRPQLNPNAVEVVAGVAKLLELVENKYTIVRP